LVHHPTICLDTKKETKKVRAAPASHEKNGSSGNVVEMDKNFFLLKKNYDCRQKSFKLTFSSNRKDFLTPAALVFRLTGRGPGASAKVIGFMR
jgi:hypothetical protein